MLNAFLIGHLGADAVSKTTNGNQFITFRVAHTDKWVDKDGMAHNETTWVDCIINGNPKVFDYLKSGQLVFVTGTLTLRVYSSAKDRCYKAGITINVKSLELLGGKSEDVPPVLWKQEDNESVEVLKYFFAPKMVREENAPEKIELKSKDGKTYYADRQGWITKT